MLQIRHSTKGSSPYETVCWSSSGARVLAGGRTVDLWHPESGKKPIVSLGGSEHKKPILAMTLSRPNGDLLLTGGADESVFVWDMQEARCIRRLTGHTQKIHQITLLGMPSTIAAIGSADCVVRLYDLTGPNRHPIQVLEEASGDITFLKAADPYSMCTTSLDSKIRQYDIRKGIIRADKLRDPIVNASLYENGWLMVVAFRSGLYQLIDLREAKILASYDIQRSVLCRLGLEFSPCGGYIFAGHPEGGVNAWDITEQTIDTSPPQKEALNLSIARHDDLFVFGHEDGTLRSYMWIDEDEII